MDMDFPIYVSIFWFFSLVYIVLEAKGMTGSIHTTLLKAIPAFSAVAFVWFSVPSLELFHLLLLVALVFCGMGDMAMEYDILPGLFLFLIGHIIFTIGFIIPSLSNLNLTSLFLFFLVLTVLLVYVYFFQKYLQTAEKPTPLLSAVIVYAVIISFSLCTSFLLWLSTEVFIGLLPFLGACFFVFSDSLIGVREFHHRFRFDEPLTMITYYLAIFLLSLGASIYSF